MNGRRMNGQYLGGSLTAWLDQVRQDFVYALRAFRRSPGFFVTSVCTVALGVGVTSTIVTLLYGLLFRPLQASHPERLMNVHVATEGPGDRSTYGTRYFVTWNEFNRMQAASRTTELAGLAEIQVSWKGFNRRPLSALLSSCNLPGVLGARLAAGRYFTVGECAQPDSAPVVVLSHSFWRSAFGGDPRVVGRTMSLNRVLFTVIGVTAEDVRAPVFMQPDIWIPITMQGITAPERQFLRQPTAAWVQVIGRLRPGESLETASAELAPLAQRAVHEHAPGKTAETTVRRAALLNFPNVVDKGQMVMALLVLAGVLVLLLGCANVANMLLARGFNRSREIAVRLAIGAGQGRIVRQLLTESLALAGFAGIAGLALASVLGAQIARLINAIAQSMIGRGDLNLQLQPDHRIVALTVCLAVLTGLLFGIAPALQARSLNLAGDLHGGLTSTPTRRRSWLQNTLVAVQVAVCAVLLLNSVLLLRGLHRVSTLDTGMARENVLVASFDLRQQQYTPQRAQALMESVLEDGLRTPGVAVAAASSLRPYHGLNVTVVNTTDRDARSDPPIRVVNLEVTESYLQAMSIPLRAGRMFTGAERSGSAPVVLVSEDFADSAFPGVNPLGQRLSMGPEGGESEIIGVTGRIRGLGPDVEPMPLILHPLRGGRWMEACLVFKYSGDAGPLASGIRQIVNGKDPELNLLLARVEENAGSAMIASRIAAGFASALAGLALLLACSGIASVVAFTVGRRRREVGIRMALGCSPGGTVSLMVRRGFLPVLAGLGCGLALALGVARFLRAMLFGLAPTDPLSIFSGILLLAGVGALAAWLPARAAASVEPAEVLRAE